MKPEHLRILAMVRCIQFHTPEFELGNISADSVFTRHLLWDIWKKSLIILRAMRK